MMQQFPRDRFFARILNAHKDNSGSSLMFRIRTLVVLLVSLCGVLFASPTATATAASTLPKVQVTIDGVTLGVQSPILPASQFSASLPDQASQQAIMTSISPYKEVSIGAVPFGTTSEFEGIAATASGGATAYRQALAKVRASQKAELMPAPVASIFGKQIRAAGALVDLPLHGVRNEPAVVVEWVSAAGSRVWIVRVVVEAAFAAARPGGVRGFVDTLGRMRLTSDSLNAPSTLLHARSASGSLARPIAAISSSTSTRKGLTLAIAATLPSPSWWNGTCDVNAHGSPTSYPLGDSYQGVLACGPRPGHDVNGNTYDPCAPYCDYHEQFFSGAFTVFEWECVELVMRYMYLGYGVNPYSANGNQVVANYGGTVLTKVSNGSGQAPVPGDVISFNSPDPSGHTAVVASSTVSNGNGTIYILQQNFGGSGYGNSNDLVPMTVSGGVIQDSFAMHATGWLEDSGAVISTSTTAVNQEQDGRLEVFARGSDNHIWHNVQSAANSGTWSGWSVLSQPYGFAGDPAVSKEADGRLEVFARGVDNHIWHNVQSAANSSSWSGWTQLTSSNTFASTPTVGQNADGRLEVLARGSDNAIYHNVQSAANSGTWSGWSMLSQPYGFAGDSTVGQNADGRLEVFARGSDNHIWHDVQSAANSGTWSGWTQLTSSNTFAGNPVVAKEADGRLEILARGSDNAIYHNVQAAANSGTWSGWSMLSQPYGFAGDSTVGQNADGRLEVFARGSDNHIWHDVQSAANSGTWSGWTQVTSSNTFASTPTVGQNTDGRLEVFARGSDSNIWHNVQAAANSGTWSGWSTLVPIYSFA